MTWTIFFTILREHWKSTGLAILALGFLWLGFSANDVTITYLDRFFWSEAQAQELGDRVMEIEKKVDELAEDLKGGRRADIEADIFRLRVESCMQPPGPLRTMYEDQIAKKITEWRQVTGQPGGSPPTVTCRELRGD